ncbi:MAG: DUF1501 domain-containing protein [Verrucomicrobiales bacterium]
MNPVLSRRSLLQTASCGFGYMAFSALSTLQAEQITSPLSPKAPHFPAKAKRVIFLCMRGGPSHVDTFDYKPELKKANGQPAQNRPGAKLLASPWEFSQHGKSGQWISSLYPNLAKHADELAIINSMHTDLPAHPQAFVQMHTGNFQFVRPSLGAWTLYGLGTENQSLPGFISLSPANGLGGAQNYGSAFLPAIYQGTPIGSEQNRGAAAGRRFAGAAQEASIPNIKNDKLSDPLQRIQLDYIKSLNMEKLRQDQHQPEVEGIIESFELAYRMQAELPSVMNLDQESKETKALYGIGDNATDAFGRNCLAACRLVENGVRFVEVTHGNWDHHRGLKNSLENTTAATDKPIAGLLADLKRRDLLKDTLVIWGGEFGRTPYAQGTDGRDHNNKGFSFWMAGGGIKGGVRHGATDEFGMQAVDGKVHIHDWHATVLHLMGLDHTKLTYNYAGRNFRLTDVYGNVVKEILA